MFKLKTQIGIIKIFEHLSKNDVTRLKSYIKENKEQLLSKKSNYSSLTIQGIYASF